MPDVSDVWRRGHPWAAVYDFAVEREHLRRPLGRLLFGVDTGSLYAGLAALDAVPTNGAVLDVPCGGGVAVRALRAGAPVRYVACDISAGMLRRTAALAGRRGLGQVQAVRADMQRLPFPAEVFDLCLSYAGLHCLPRPADAVAEVARCLRPGGRFEGTVFLVDTGVRYLPLRWAARAMGVLGPSGGLGDVERWLRDGGLRVERLERMGAMALFSARRRLPPHP